jgi:hypothetical protein
MAWCGGVARAIVSQLYLKNCALVVLSRLGVLDNVQAKHLALTGAEGGVIKDAAWNILEAFQLAGACTVVCPLWGGGATGGDLGQLARLILLLRFYFELPNWAHEGRPVAKTLQQVQVGGWVGGWVDSYRMECLVWSIILLNKRKDNRVAVVLLYIARNSSISMLCCVCMDMYVQLWLRSATIDDVLEFLHHSPLPEKGAEELCLELSSFKKNKKPSASATPHPGDTSSSNGGDAKLFSHFSIGGC